MDKDILVIAHFSDDFDTGGNNRFNYLMELLFSKDLNAEFITSDFSHFKKTKKNIENLTINYKATFISEPIYKKNVSFKRIFSHYKFSRNVKSYLEKREKPDVIYCAVPSLSLASVVAKYAKINDIYFVVDIQDLWPEAFKMVFDIPILSNIIFYPMKKKANYIYSVANDIVAVSNTYLKRALKSNKIKNIGHSIYLGTDLQKFDQLTNYSTIRKNYLKDELWIVYIGTLGYSYDLKLIIDALYYLKTQGIENLKFIVMGDGPLRKDFEQYAIDKNIVAEFTGRLDYEEMVGILKNCDIAVNPIKKGSAGSIINKVGDYAAAGLPVINTQENLEYRELLTKFKAGINYLNEDPIELAEIILELSTNEKIRKKMGINSRKLAQSKFDRNKNYEKIVELLLK